MLNSNNDKIAGRAVSMINYKEEQVCDLLAKKSNESELYVDRTIWV